MKEYSISWFMSAKVSFCCIPGSSEYQNEEILPSRELTYPTWGKGKSSSKVIFDGIC